MKNSNWDLDLRAGEVGEMKLADLISMDTIEVKTDRRWHETGNLYIETECFQQSTRTWEDSGISVSRATHWAFILEDGVIILPTFRLKDTSDEPDELVKQDDYPSEDKWTEPSDSTDE